MLQLTPEQKALIEQIHQRPSCRKRSELITKVLELKAKGLTHAQIGTQLGYSTVYIGNVSSLAQKLYRDGCCDGVE